jgi:hypothetical protein
VPGFNSPSILFLNTWDAAERDYMAGLFPKLLDAGYTRMVEPCAGGFVMPSVAAVAGVPGSAMDTSDISLYTSILGTAFSDGDIESLGMKLDGKPVKPRRKSRLGAAAELIYVQLLARMECKPDAVFWNELAQDIRNNRTRHIDTIEGYLQKMDGRLYGLRYRPLDILEHVEEVRDDPNAFISANPPTYTGGFEKFYDTGGRVTWNEPAYEVFDPAVHQPEIAKMMKGRDALLLMQQQAPPHGNAGPAVYARHLSLGEYVFIHTNRPDEVLELAGGPMVYPMRSTAMEKLDVPVIPMDHAITRDSRIEVAQVPAKVAAYYRDLWMHKLDYKNAGCYIAVTIDGYMAGLMGFDTSTIYRSYHEKWQNCLLMTFAVGAPYDEGRLTRLITMLALSVRTWKVALSPRDVTLAYRGVITAEMTPYPEVKGLRGLMDLASREDDPKYGFKLIYHSEAMEWTSEEALRKWLKDEKNRRKAIRAQQKAEARKSA